MTASDEVMAEAMAFLHMARNYQKAASRLLDSVASEKVGAQYPLSDPIYFLCAHTVELAFKAFLLFHGEVIPTSGRDGHNLRALHARCAALGLALGPDDPNGLQTIVELLSSENDHHGFRYFNDKGGTIPELPWTCDVVNRLIQAIRAVFGADPRVATGRPWKLKLQVLLGKQKKKEEG